MNEHREQPEFSSGEFKQLLEEQVRSLDNPPPGVLVMPDGAPSPPDLRDVIVPEAVVAFTRKIQENPDLVRMTEEAKARLIDLHGSIARRAIELLETTDDLSD